MRILNLIKNTKQAFIIQLSHASAMSVIERERQDMRFLRLLLLGSVVFLVLLEPSLAMAEGDAVVDGGGDADDGLTNAANKILGLLTGTLGKAVATIAVVVMGMMAMFGKLEWERAFKVVLGIAIVFGAASILSLLGGTTIGGT